MRDYDVIVAPGGDDRPNRSEGVKKGQVGALGPAGCTALRNAVRRGATYVGVCAGAFTAARAEVGLTPFKAINEQAFGLDEVCGWVALRRSPLAPASLRDAAQALSLGSGTTVRYHQGPVLGELPRAQWPRHASHPVALCKYAAPVVPDAGCLASRMRAFRAEREAMRGGIAIACNDYGAGSVVLVGPHLESNDDTRVRAVLPRLVLAARGAL